ncbi:MAG: SPOR domain-containing protein [Pseudomonadota bacterium]
MISRSVLTLLLLVNVGVGVYFGMFSEPASQAEMTAETQQVDELQQAPAIARVTTEPEFPEPLFVAAAEPSENVEPANNSDVITPAATNTQPRECRVWGPLSDPEAFDDLSNNLEAIGGFPEIREIEVVLSPDFMVFVGPLPNMAQARQVAADLRDLQIDNYVFNREDSGPGVSVGVFSREGLARRQHQKVVQLGYEVSIEPMQRSQKAYNLYAHIEQNSVHYPSSISGCMDIAQNP